MMVKQTFVAISACALVVLCSTSRAYAQCDGECGGPVEYVVNNDAELREALQLINAGDSIRFANNITLLDDLPNVSVGVTINGDGFTLSGNDTYRGLFLGAFNDSGQVVSRFGATTVTIENLTITNTVATGGDGGSGASAGGGGAGLGGGIFVASGFEAAVSNVHVLNTRAIGGNGGSAIGVANAGGGGGLGAAGAVGDDAGPGGGGGATHGAHGGNAHNPGGNGSWRGNGGGGGHGGEESDGYDGGSGGGVGGSASDFTGHGGNGGFGGGGGGAFANGYNGGQGGFGGGGGGATVEGGSEPFSGSGGNGGFGGGGGGGLAVCSDCNGRGFAGSFGGNGGNSGGGGGGAGVGGGVFVQDGGYLSINGAFTINGVSAAGGRGASDAADGQGVGSGAYFQGNPDLYVSPGNGEHVVLNGDLVDERGAGAGDGGEMWLFKEGDGKLTLGGNNAFARLFMDRGTTSVSREENLANDENWLGDEATLEVNGNGRFTRWLGLSGGNASINVTPGSNATWSGYIFENIGSCDCDCECYAGTHVRFGGGGKLTLLTSESEGNWWTGGTTIGQNTEIAVDSDYALGAWGSPVYLGDESGRGIIGTMGRDFVSERNYELGFFGGGIDVPTSSTATFTGSISGDGSLTKFGGGTLTLNGENSYAGTTTVDAGTLVAGSGTAFGNSTALTVNNGATVAFNGYSQNFYTIAGGGTIAFGGGETLTVGADNSSSSFAGSLTGNGNLTKAGTGSLTLSGQSDYSGETSVDGGTLIAGSTGAFGNSRVFNIAGGATVDFNGFSQNLFTLNGTGTVALTNGATLTIGGDGSSSAFFGSLVGSGGITKAGGGTFVLGGNNSYTGLTSVAGGTLRAGASNAFGSSRSLSIDSGGTLDMNGVSHSFFSVSSSGTLALNGNARITIGGDNSNSTVGGTIVGNGTVIKEGTGVLSLTGDNFFSGGLQVNNGTVAVTSDANLGASSNTISLGSANGVGILAISGAGFSSSRAISVGGQGGVVDTAGGTNALLSGGISGSAGLTKSGAGTLTLAGASSFDGALAVSGGTLRAGAADVFPSGLLSLAGGTTADLNGFDQAVGSLAGTGSLQLTSGALLAIGGDGSSSIFGGSISGTGGLVKNGDGLLALTGTNAYSRGIRVNGGTLSGSSSTLPGTIVNDATLVFDQAANGAYSGAITGTGTLVKTGSGTLTFAGSNAYRGGTLISAGGIVGSTSNLQGLIINNGALTFNQATDGVFNGLIGGAGTVTKLGGGNVTFSSSNAFTGLLTVGQGRLTMSNIALPGTVSVGTQATLAGTGTIGGDLNLGGQLLLPAITPSTGALSAVSGFNQLRTASIVPFATRDLPSMVINGDLTAAQGSTMTFTVGSNGVAPILVNGRANLIGTHLDVTIDDPNPSRSATYTAIKALNGLSVAGSDASTTSTSILPVLTQGRNSLLVTILNLRVPTTEVATTPNGIAAGKGIDAVKQCSTGELCDAVKEVLAITGPEFDTALNSLAGEIHASSMKMLINDSRGMTDLVRDELTQAEHDAEDDDAAGSAGGAIRPWMQFTGEHSSFKTGEFSGGTANVGGGGGGLSFRPRPRIITGGGAGFSFGSLSLTDISGTSALKAPRAFGYSGFKFGPFHLHVGSSVSKNNTSTKRGISIHARVPDENGNQVPMSNGIDRQADADADGYTQDVWTEWQHTKKFVAWLMDSKAGVRATRYVRRAFTEEGAGAISLEGGEDVVQSRETHFDFNLTKKRGAWRPRIVLNYLHEFGDDQTTADVNFLRRPDSQFEVSGFAIPRDVYHGLFGLTFRTLTGLEYTFEYETTQASAESHNALHFRMRFK